MKKSRLSVWVLVDKRGVILEAHSLCHRQSGATAPIFTIWKRKKDAKAAIGLIKAEMTKETWKTWKFKVVKYTRG